MAWRRKDAAVARARSTRRRRATTLAGARCHPITAAPNRSIASRRRQWCHCPGRITDLAGISAAHSLITAEELTTLRQPAYWSRQARVAFGCSNGLTERVVGRHLSRVVCRVRGWLSSISASDRRTGGDRAAAKVAESYSHFGELRQLDRLGQVTRVAAGETAPRALAHSRSCAPGSWTIWALQRRGRGRRAPFRGAMSQQTIAARLRSRPDETGPSTEKRRAVPSHN